MKLAFLYRGYSSINLKREPKYKVNSLFMFLLSLTLACNSGDKKTFETSQIHNEKYDTVYLNVIDTGSAYLIVDKKKIPYTHGQLFFVGKEKALQLIPLTNQTDTQILLIKMIGEYEYKVQILNKNLLPIDSLKWQGENNTNTHVLIIQNNSR